MKITRSYVCVLAWLGLWLGGGQVGVQAQNATAAKGKATPAIEQTVEAAVKKLLAEGTQVLRSDGDLSPSPYMRRPHPSVARWDEAHAFAGLRRIAKKLSGNREADAYVRWHIMQPIMKAVGQRFADDYPIGEYELPGEVLSDIEAITAHIPGALTFPWKSPHTFTPVEIWREYRRLNLIPLVREGFPPFERVYEGEEALKRMPEAQRREIEANRAKAEKLRSQFTQKYNPAIAQYNRRAQQMRTAVFELQGEISYLMCASGDAKLVTRLIDAMGVQLEQQNRAAFDLMAYMYIATFDGRMGLYDADEIRDFQKRLSRLGRTHAIYREYAPKPWNPVLRNFRRFDDAVFHLVSLLDDDQITESFGYVPDLSAIREQAGHVRIGARGAEIDPWAFTLEDVRKSVNRAILSTYSPPTETLKRSITPSYGRKMVEANAVGPGGRHINGAQLDAALHESGYQALMCWAMLAAGESYQNPILYSRINYALSVDVPYTFDRALRTHMLSLMPRQQWGPWFRRDARWLGEAMTGKGGFASRYDGRDSGNSWGNNADAMYGLMGLIAAEKSGYEINTNVWEGIDRYWRAAQDSSGGWAFVSSAAKKGGAQKGRRGGVSANFGGVSGPMTAAGVYALSTTEKILHNRSRGKHYEKPSKALKRGLAWLDKNFDPSPDQDDWYFYMWTMQQVGRASGYRTFNGHDWFRDGTALILNRQSVDGLWRETIKDARHGFERSPVYSTAFAMLYLGVAYSPPGIAKIRHASNNWNNFPYDASNFSDYVSAAYEVDLGWEVTNLRRPLYQQMENPILYFSTDEPFEFSAAEIKNLRAYIEAGGLLVTNAESTRPNLARSYKDFFEKLFPGMPLEKVRADSDMRSLHAKLSTGARLEWIHNGLRPVAVHFAGDIAGQLQKNDKSKREAFEALSNVYLYSIGLRPGESRLATSYVMPPEPAGAVRGTIVRLKHGGNARPEPAADTQLAALLMRDHDVRVNVAYLDAAALKPSHKFALLSATGDAKLTGPQAKAIQAWIKKGGTLWIDAAGGSAEAAANADAIAKQILPDRPTRGIQRSHPIISGEGLKGAYDNRNNVQYRLQTLRQMSPTNNANLLMLAEGDRPGIVLAKEDLTCGLAGLRHWGILGYAPDSARKLVINGVLDALKK